MSEQPFILPDDVNPNFPLWVTEEEDGSLTVNWDPDHKITSVFNDWTEQDFIDLLTQKAQEVIDQLA